MNYLQRLSNKLFGTQYVNLMVTTSHLPEVCKVYKTKTNTRDNLCVKSRGIEYVLHPNGVVTTESGLSTYIQLRVNSKNWSGLTDKIVSFYYHG